MADKKCVIVCPGASLSIEDLQQAILDGVDCFAVNRALAAFDGLVDAKGMPAAPEAVFLIDSYRKFGSIHEQLSDVRVLKVVKRSRLAEYPAPRRGIDILSGAHPEQRYDRHYQKNGIQCPLLSLVFAWLSLVPEYEIIGIMGADCSVGESTYFKDFGCEEGSKERKNKRYGLAKQYICNWAADAEEDGCLTINLSAGSGLSDCLQTMTIEEFINESRGEEEGQEGEGAGA